MTRMTKEEKELRDFVKREFPHWYTEITNKMITALVRAVKERCAKVAENHDLVCCEDEGLCGFVVDNARSIAAAIRKGGK